MPETTFRHKNQSMKYGFATNPNLLAQNLAKLSKKGRGHDEYDVVGTEDQH